MRDALELLMDAGQASPPIDVVAVAGHLGVKVVDVDLSDSVSGMLIRDGNADPTVGINRTHAQTRKRFTLAHELGHLRLHKGRPIIVDSPVRVNLRDRTSGMATDREEMEANRFAAELLMPEEMVFQAVSNLSDVEYDDIDLRLAGQFNVSRAAMNYRLINLGILS